VVVETNVAVPGTTVILRALASWATRPRVWPRRRPCVAHGGEVGRDGAELDAVFRGVFLGKDQLLARVQQRLARDAADVEAGAAERGAFFHEGDPEASLRGAKGAHIPPGPAPSTIRSKEDSGMGKIV